jgi:hypothetical protein
MSERPILFSGEMVRAILRGQKTQTRRVVSPGTASWGSGPGWEGPWDWSRAWSDDTAMPAFQYLHVPYAGNDKWGWEGTVHRLYPRTEAGHSLWVRESWHDRTDRPASMHDPSLVCYAADGEPAEPSRYRKRPSIHMPRWASRLTLRVTEVRVERVREISEADAQAEGAEPTCGHPERGAFLGIGPCYREGFAQLWEDLNGPRGFGWDGNPWVFVVGFEVAK